MTTQLPHHPVGHFNKSGGGIVDSAVLQPDLYQLGEVPLRGNAPAITGQERLLALNRNFVEACGYWLCGVVLP